MPNLTFKNVTVYYGNKRNRLDVIESLNVSFLDGKINVLLGESGSGKTTILKSLVEMVDYEGEIMLGNTDISKILVNKRNISYASQNINLYPHMTIFENIAFPLKIRKLPKDVILRKTRAMAEKLEIAQCLNQRGKYLSIGQQQRAMLARELVFEPNILLMDEPFSSLDPTLRKEMCKLVKNLQKELGTTILYVTHSYDEAVNMADQLFILEEGRIVASGTPKKLTAEKNSYLQTMFESEHVSPEALYEEKKDR